MVNAYIDDVLVITKYNCKYHLKSLDRVLQILEELVLKVNAKKSFFGQTETEYLVFWVSNNGVRPISSKV